MANDEQDGNYRDNHHQQRKFIPLEIDKAQKHQNHEKEGGGAHHGQGRPQEGHPDTSVQDETVAQGIIRYLQFADRHIDIHQQGGDTGGMGRFTHQRIQFPLIVDAVISDTQIKDREMAQDANLLNKQYDEIGIEQAFQHTGKMVQGKGTISQDAGIDEKKDVKQAREKEGADSHRIRMAQSRQEELQENQNHHGQFHPPVNRREE